MPRYNFTTLNDKDLEELVRDLLSKELSIPLQSFKVGKDKGIDLRYSTNSSENEIIVQVKHYYKSGYSSLVHKLKSDEKSKVDKLNPRRYILATSVELSPSDKEYIKNTLSPHILNTNDIYGLDDLNRLLTLYPEIEKSYYKLWFSNTEVINKIINNGIEGRSAFYEQKLKKNLELYVFTSSYNKALEILERERVLLITGTPGIGKTSLANMITYNTLSKDVRLVYIDDDIKDAEDIFDPNPEAKQLFYFDDFLGSNYLDIISTKNSDKSIVNFIERVRVSKNKSIILTTRSTILNQAKSSSERINRANLNAAQYELEIKDYSDYDKALILYNHLFYNDINSLFIGEVFKNKNYRRIIKHKNYNPRLIEYFTLEHNINHLAPEQYIPFIISNLNNPSEIWESALKNQLNDAEKCLLFSLLSLGKPSAYKVDIETAFDKRIENEVQKYGLRKEFNMFNVSFKNLLDGYITNIVYNSHFSSVDFINPSLKDYLISYFNKNKAEKWRLIEAFVYVEQFANTFRSKSNAANHIVIEKEEIKPFIEAASRQVNKSTNNKCSTSISLDLICLYFSYVENDHFLDDIDKYIISEFEQINWNDGAYSEYNPTNFINLIDKIDDQSKSFMWIRNNWDHISEFLFKASSYDTHVSKIVDLFEKMSVPYDEYREDDEQWKEILTNSLERAFKDIVETEIDQEQNEIRSDDEFDSLETKIKDSYDNLATLLFPYESQTCEFDLSSRLNKDEIINSNLQADHEAESYDDEWRFVDKEPIDNPEAKIDALFDYFE